MRRAVLRDEPKAAECATRAGGVASSPGAADTGADAVSMGFSRPGMGSGTATAAKGRQGRGDHGRSPSKVGLHTAPPLSKARPMTYTYPMFESCFVSTSHDDDRRACPAGLCAVTVQRHKAADRSIRCPGGSRGRTLEDAAVPRWLRPDHGLGVRGGPARLGRHRDRDAGPGRRAARGLLQREPDDRPARGRSCVSASYDSTEVMAKGADTAMGLRADLVHETGMRVVEVAAFELALAHLEVPELV